MCRAQKFSNHTIRSYTGDLRKFESWSPCEDAADALVPDQIEAWRHHLGSADYAPATIRRRLAALRSLAKWLERNGVIADDPFAKLELAIKLPKRLPRNLGKRDLRLLLQGVRNGDGSASASRLLIQVTVELLLTTGIRVGEACSIRLRDIDLEGRTIRIMGKGSRERHVFLIDSQLLKLVRRYLKARASLSPPTDHLLVTTRGTQASTDYIRRKLHEVAKAAKVGRTVTPHMLRHTAATQLLECGVDIRFVQRLLGHSSIATTEIYTHVSDVALRAAIVGAGLRRQLE